MKDKENLISQNMGLVHFVVKRFAGRGLDMEELFQVGCVGLCKAADGFKEELGLRFSTYAVPVILGEVKRFLRDNTQVHISRSLKEQNYKIQTVMEQFISEHGTEPSLAQLETLTGFAREDIIAALDSHRPVESLDTLVYETEEGQRKVDMLADKREPYQELLNKLVCKEIMSKLEDKERRLLYLRYFCDKTQEQTARELAMSQVQVSRMEKKLLLRIRGSLTEKEALHV